MKNLAVHFCNENLNGFRKRGLYDGYSMSIILAQTKNPKLDFSTRKMHSNKLEDFLLVRFYILVVLIALTDTVSATFINTYTSTSTGNAASRSSSLQLGGNSSCTWARVPCCSVTSNERFVGSANLCMRSVYAGRVSYNMRINWWLFLVEWKPVIWMYRDFLGYAMYKIVSAAVQMLRRHLYCMAKQQPTTQWSSLKIAMIFARTHNFLG